MLKPETPEQQAIIWLNGEEITQCAWWKVWKNVLNLVAEAKGSPAEITIELLPVEETA